MDAKMAAGSPDIGAGRTRRAGGTGAGALAPRKVRTRQFTPFRANIHAISLWEEMKERGAERGSDLRQQQPHGEREWCEGKETARMARDLRRERV